MSSIRFGRDCLQPSLFLLSGLPADKVEAVAEGLTLINCTIVSSGSIEGSGSILFSAPRSVVYWLAGRFAPLDLPLRFSDGAVQGQFCSL